MAPLPIDIGDASSTLWGQSGFRKIWRGRWYEMPVIESRLGVNILNESCAMQMNSCALFVSQQEIKLKSNVVCQMHAMIFSLAMNAES
jgi:hypothetical protein